jgi:hypothetical protein
MSDALTQVNTKYKYLPIFFQCFPLKAATAFLNVSSYNTLKNTIRTININIKLSTCIQTAANGNCQG